MAISILIIACVILVVQIIAFYLVAKWINKLYPVPAIPDEVKSKDPVDDSVEVLTPQREDNLEKTLSVEEQ